jgi:hypothetical protein
LGDIHLPPGYSPLDAVAGGNRHDLIAMSISAGTIAAAWQIGQRVAPQRSRTLLRDDPLLLEANAPAECDEASASLLRHHFLLRSDEGLEHAGPELLARVVWR